MYIGRGCMVSYFQAILLNTVNNYRILSQELKSTSCQWQFPLESLLGRGTVMYGALDNILVVGIIILYIRPESSVLVGHFL